MPCWLSPAALTFASILYEHSQPSNADRPIKTITAVIAISASFISLVHIVVRILVWFVIVSVPFVYRTSAIRHSLSHQMRKSSSSWSERQSRSLAALKRSQALFCRFEILTRKSLGLSNTNVRLANPSPAPWQVQTPLPARLVQSVSMWLADLAV